MNNNQLNNQQSNQPTPYDEQPIRVRVTIPTVEPILTYILLGAIVLIYLLTQSMSPRELDIFFQNWAKINNRVYEGEYYRLLTSMFLHLNLTHILFNGYALFLFGREVERIFGHVRFAIIYFLGGLSGSVGSLLYTDAPSIGASGAIFAVFAAMGVYFYHHRQLYGQSAQVRLTQMAVLAIINIVFGFIPSMRIDNAAHIGGLLGGIVLAWFICPELKLEGISSMEPEVVDVNKPENWIVVPVIYAIALVIVVLLFSTT